MTRDHHKVARHSFVVMSCELDKVVILERLGVGVSHLCDP